MSLNQRCSDIRFRWWLQLLLSLGLRRAAAAWAEKRLRQVPDDTHALASMAHLLARDRHWVSAQALLDRLVQLRPQDASAWFNLGYVLEQQQQLLQAEAAFRSATRLAPQLDRGWYGLGLCLIAQQRLDEAVPALRRTTELQPLSPHAWYQLAHVHAQRLEHTQAAQIIDHLRGFEPRVAAQLQRETSLSALPANQLRGAA